MAQSSDTGRPLPARLVWPFEGVFREASGLPVTTAQGMIGFDDGRRFRRSGSRMRSHLVNALREPIGADNTRTDFALAA